MDKQELFVTLAGLKGAAAAILLALLLSEEPLGRGDLELITGYSGVTVGKALDLLLARQLVLVDGVQGFRALLAELHDSPSRQVQGFRARPATELHDSCAPDNRLSGHDPPFPAGETLAKNFFKNFSPSSSSSIQTESLNAASEEEEETPETRKILQLLATAGIGGRSKKAQEVLRLGLDLGYVKAHVKARERALARGEEYPAGWLITKLLSGDPAPAPAPCKCGRCEECQKRTLGKYPVIQR